MTFFAPNSSLSIGLQGVIAGAPVDGIGAPVVIATAVTNTAQFTIGVGLTAEVPAGLRIFAYADTHSAIEPTGIANSPAPPLSWIGTPSINAGGRKKLYYADLTEPLPTGTTITVTPGQQGRSNLIIFTVEGLTPDGVLDVRHANGTSGASGTQPTITSPALAENADKLVIGMVELAGPATAEEITEPAGWTTLGSIGGALWLLHLAYQIVPAGDADARIYAPTLSTARAWTADILSIKAA